MVKIYRACDGKEFLTANECLKYERRCSLEDSWDYENAKDVSSAESITFGQFLIKSGIVDQNFYYPHIFNCIKRAFERSGYKCRYRAIETAPMNYIIDFLRITNFSDRYIWRGFGTKTASRLFFNISAMFDIDLWPKYALDRGIV